MATTRQWDVPLTLRQTGAGRVPFVAIDREHDALADELASVFERVVRHGGFILGEEVERFEHAWAQASGTEHCVGVGSGTAALAILLRAVGIGPGDEVIVPAHTFVASAFAVLHAGATPVLCDVEDATGLLDLEAAAALVGPRTAAVLPVHLYGQLCDLEALRAFASRRGLAVVEDAAQAHGAHAGGRGPGTAGAGAAYSFYPSKNLGALGDAGAICTTDDAVAERARRLRNLGQRSKGEHLDLGGNERLDALQAAFLSVKLPHLEPGNVMRRAHARRYARHLGGSVRMLPPRPGVTCVFHLFAVRVRHRDAVLAALHEAGIDAATHYRPALHEQPALHGLAAAPAPLPRAEAWAAEELSLPMSPWLTRAEIDRAAAACLAAVAEVGDE